MTRQEAIEILRQDLPRIIWQRDKSRGRHAGYVCPMPNCSSGSGTHGTGISTKDGIHYTCWAGGCFSNADVFSIIGLKYGLNDFNEQLKKACELYGFDYNNLENDTLPNRPITPKKPIKEEQAAAEPQTDYTDFFKQCAANIDKCDYLDKRGISKAIQKQFGIGYCEKWQHPTALKEYEAGNRERPPYWSNRIIIPTSSYSYLARDVKSEEELGENQKGCVKLKAGNVHFFNAGILNDKEDFIFLTEGEIDALSLVEIGYKACAMGSSNMAERFANYVITLPNKPTTTLLICCDNDEAGYKAAEVLTKKFTAAGIKHYNAVNILGKYKDANKCLVNDREGLTKRAADFITGIKEADAIINDMQVEVSKDIRESVAAELKAEPKEELIINVSEDAVVTRSAASDLKETEKEAYLSHTSIKYLRDSFELEIEQNASLPTISTGLPSLDEIINGGLQKGLYFIGGISSIGKTTFCMQIMDNVAKAGNDVLVFALEMSKYELMAKSISRYTLFADLETYKTTVHAKSTNAILYRKNNALSKGYTEEEKHVISLAKEHYFNEVAEHLFIYEGVGNIGVKDIREAIEKHISFTGRKPVVLIDYLQILAPYDVKATDKQNMDKAVLELKRISRDEGIAVIGISSFNRENYTNAVTLASFKESGAIEYTSDILLGLQYSGMDKLPTESEEAYKRRINELRETESRLASEGKPQHLQVKVLKNRNGKKGAADLNFIPLFNYVYDENPFTNKASGKEANTRK